MTHPPVRWAESELPEDLARLIASAAPSPSDDTVIARLRERLHGSLGPAFDTRAPRSRPLSRALSALQRGRWLCAAAIATAGLSFLSVRAYREGPAAPASGVRAPATLPQPGPEPVPLLAAPVATTSSAAPAPLAAANASAAASPPKAPPTTRATKQHPRVAAAHGGPTADKVGLAAELQGLAEIRGLLRSSPAQALAAVEMQQQRFARGALGPERELLRIEALLRGGRTDEAKLRAARATNAHPYGDRIEKLFMQSHTRDGSKNARP